MYLYSYLVVHFSWVRPDLAPQAGMTFLTMGIPTGYHVNRDTIQQMYLQNVPGLKRVRFRDSTLILFYEYVSTRSMPGYTSLLRENDIITLLPHFFQNLL